LKGHGASTNAHSGGFRCLIAAKAGNRHIIFGPGIPTCYILERERIFVVDDAHNLEAREHLLRVQARVAEEAVAQQRVITEKIANNAQLADIGQKVLDATLAYQTERNPFCETVLAHIARAVEAACQALGLDLQKGVVHGVLPMRGLGASSSDFYGTGVALVTIDASLVPFTGMLTDLLAESFEYRETDDGLTVVLDAEACLRRITGGKTMIETHQDAMEGREALIHYWERFFLHFAGLSFSWPMPKLTEAQEAIKFQLTSAMEVFVVGHEYGHHSHRHNADALAASSIPPEEAYAYEFEADRTAWSIAKYLGAAGFSGKLTPVRNLWMESSAGAVAYLSAAEAVRRVRSILEIGTDKDRPSLTHPLTEDRLVALERWDGFVNDPLEADFRRLRHFVGYLIGHLYRYLRPKFFAGHRAGFRPIHL
jgi:hypothetical protein